MCLCFTYCLVNRVWCCCGFGCSLLVSCFCLVFCILLWVYASCGLLLFLCFVGVFVGCLCLQRFRCFWLFVLVICFVCFDLCCFDCGLPVCLVILLISFCTLVDCVYGWLLGCWLFG